MDRQDGSTGGPGRPTVGRELDLVGGRREFTIAGVTIAGRRRRPSGEAAPLPRNLKGAATLWLIFGGLVLVVWVMLFVIPSSTQWWTEQDYKIVSWFVDRRTETLTSLAKGLDASHPSRPVAGLGVTLGVMAYSLIGHGKWRRVMLVASGALVVAVAAARVYLGVDHPSDGWVSLFFAPAVAVLVFRLFAPEASFPISWKRGVTAHLDVTGVRGEAIRKALRDQLGLDVVGIEPFGQEGSGGSTPLRLELARDDSHGEQYLFAKLYSQTHLRSDRWYKVGRTILYGALEDELRFTSVRRLVEYEDYIQRVMRDCGIPSAEPFGVVEITPEREYLMVSQFLFGSEELTEADVDVDIIDDALGVIRQMWDAGLAHRDVKPANVMIRDGRIVLIDVAFGTIRPSPWRQAVDLANMMVILALRTNAELVYQRALIQFDAHDIAEAFAATRSVTLPSQSRSSLALLKREEGIDIVEEFRNLAPTAEPISIQRWSARRIGLALGAALLTMLLLTISISEITGGGTL